MELTEWEQALAEGRRDAIQQVVKALEASPIRIPENLNNLKHHFAEGQYAREMFIPGGTVIVGKVHKHAHVNVISKGRCLVFTEHDGAVELQAPLTFVSKPTTQRLVVAVEDTVWTTVHTTDSTDLSEIEKEIIQ